VKLSAFDYPLPKELIAQYPARKRDDSRMMVLDRAKKKIFHKNFKDITSYLKKGDAMVFNNSRVIPARIPCRKATGGKAEIFILKKIGEGIYEALVRPGAALRVGKMLFTENDEPLARVLEDRKVGKLVKFEAGYNIEKELDKIGEVPLPPYIKRKPEESDRERYQTVYAKKDGSTASPTAGLHFTDEALSGISSMGVGLNYVTLHVSYGTFAPVKVEDIERHKMHSEYYEISGDTRRAVDEAKAAGGRVVAVGTTSCRVLEGSAISGKESGWTDIFIYPPYTFKSVDMLLTNFHLPKSTLIMLVSAFAGREFIMEAYHEAVKEKYRLFSYGDCMLIL